ncbi:toxin glutamine deamidase domain-containing protein [Jidongwangia harbinensis]|uniref:toxin glutamine deamidase domain-containing protein n=1 Tax=Jidongwangia harbinensis TaxID=2878561 RepID=UPI001CD9A573|nr:toxin glutamine deamidase domain-containing protein [Jidongwangia harbinensis]MCA2212700.1 hypothetical protein [Jidongwangia harbinensis]
MTVLPSPIPHPLDYCPWDLPGWAYEALEWVVGFQWPDGNEAETWDVADRWYALAQALAGPRDEANQAADQIISGYGGAGVTVEAFMAAWAKVSDDENAPLNALLSISHELGRLVEECGCDIEGAKIEAWIELGIFVIELIGMAVAVALTLGAASPAAAGLIAATRIAIQQIFRKLIAQLSKKAMKQSLKEAGERAAKQLTTKAGLRNLGRDALREGLDEAREEFATNAGIQLYQNSTGRRDGLDWNELGMSTAAGFAGGAASTGAQLGRGTHGSGPGDLLRGAGGEVLGELGGAAVTGQLDLEGLAKSATSGAAGSAVQSARAGVGDALGGLQVPTLGATGAVDSSSAPSEGASTRAAGPSTSDVSPFGASPSVSSATASGPSASGPTAAASGPTAFGPTSSASAPSAADLTASTLSGAVPTASTPSGAVPTASTPSGADSSPGSVPPSSGSSSSAPLPSGSASSGVVSAGPSGASGSMSVLSPPDPSTASPSAAAPPNALDPTTSSGTRGDLNLSALAPPSDAPGPVPPSAGPSGGVTSSSAAPTASGPVMGPLGAASPAATPATGPIPAGGGGGGGPPPPPPPPPGPPPHGVPSPTTSPSPRDAASSPATSPTRPPTGTTAPPPTAPLPTTAPPSQPTTAPPPQPTTTPPPSQPTTAPPPRPTPVIATSSADLPAAPPAARSDTDSDSGTEIAWFGEPRPIEADVVGRPGGGPGAGLTTSPAFGSGDFTSGVPGNVPAPRDAPADLGLMAALPPGMVAGPDRSNPAEADAERRYLRNIAEQRAAYGANRRAAAATELRDRAAVLERQARDARRAARMARFLRFDRHGAAFHEETANLLARNAQATAARADGIAGETVPMDPVAVDAQPQDWHRVNVDVGPLAAGPVATGDRSVLTGNDHPPAVDRTRRYGEPRGLRPPLALHQLDLERAVPRDGNGAPVRMADPRAPYFRLVNDGGPQADPTRGINCQDCVLSFYETYVHGRPRVSAPRTFDGYLHGETAYVQGGERVGTERAELVTSGRFQSLCDNVAGEPPAVAQQRVDRAFTDIAAQLTAGGPGSFAFIVNAWEGGTAHAWAAVNQGGEILFVDPQSGAVAGPGTIPTLYGHRGVPDPHNVVQVDALVVNGQGVPLTFPGRNDGAWHVEHKTLPPLPPRPTPVYVSAAYQDTPTVPDVQAASIVAELASAEPFNAFTPGTADDRSPAPPPPAANHAGARAAYFGYAAHARRTHEENRRDEYAEYLATNADICRANAVHLGDQANAAQRDGLTLRADRYRASAREASTEAEELADRAAQVRSGEVVPDLVRVEGPAWARINDDVGHLAGGAVETDDSSALTGDDFPPPVDRSRRYGIRGGLRPPLAVHQSDLENAMPREPDGRVQRLADPRVGRWFGLANDGGPEADPTRGINCVDGVLALFDTYVHGRPRVSAPRTFDSYAHGDPTRPLGAEEGGLTRIQDTVRGEFQGMCPYVGGLDPHQAQQAVDTALTNLSNHLHNIGHGAFAFIVTDSEGGSAHAWAAVNHHGTILFLDPQTRRISENLPLYRHQGTPADGNVVSMDAMVVDGRGEWSSIPYHEAGLWSRTALEPTGAEPEPPEKTPAQREEERLLQSLTSADRTALEQAHTEAETVAARVSRDMHEVAALLDHPEGEIQPRVEDEQYRVKSLPSLARKFLERQATGAMSLDRFIEDVNDRVRFTIETGEKQYGHTVRNALSLFRERGYSVEQVLSFWGDGRGRHNGLNVTLIDPQGYRLELQFPTTASRAVGKLTHSLYEDVRLETASAETRIEAFLRILALNKRYGMSGRQPTDLGEIPGLVSVDTSFPRWALGKGAYPWAQYRDNLHRNNTPFSDTLQSFGLTPSDIPGYERLGVPHEPPQSGVPRLQGEGLERDHEPDRLHGAAPGTAPSGDVARSPEGVDVRSGTGGTPAVRRHVPGPVDGGRSGDGGTPGAGAPADGTAERGDNSGDVRGGRPERLDVRPTPGVAPGVKSADLAELASAQQSVLTDVAPHSAEFADIIVRLLVDHVTNNHALNVTSTLLNPSQRTRTVELLVELAQIRAVGPYGGVLQAFLEANPGAGALFDPVEPGINVDAAGRSRKQTYVEAGKLSDPSRNAGPDTSVANLARLEEYAQRLNRRVLPAVLVELDLLARAAAELCGEVQQSARAKRAPEILNKVQRMVSGARGRPRPNYRAGDVIDAVGGRLTVKDMQSLEQALGVVKRILGVGDGGRILEVENMYAEPKATAPDYRVVPLVVGIEVDGQPYTYELQLTTHRASVAADLEHNTIFKSYVGLTEAEQLLVKFAMREAAALDQLETRQGVDRG